MRLARCEGCRRHVRVEETQCPFCGATHAGSHTADGAFVRLSRAAVFASAAVVGGCWTSRAPATPPVENTSDKTAATAGVLEGIVTQNGGAPQPDVKVTLMRGSSDYEYNGEKVAETRTDANGRYRFSGLADGQYTVIVEAGRITRRGWPRRPVVVPQQHDNEGDMVIYPYEPQQEPMPYGAPPARRRVV